MTSFRLTPNPVGPGRVEVDGQDVTDNVAGVQVDAAIGQPTTVTLHVQAGGEIVGDGVIQVVATQPADDPEVICRFLDQVDPVLLEQEAFRTLGPGQMNTTIAAIDVLKRIARGQ